MPVFLFLFSIFFVYLSWTKPKWALACVIAGLPTYLVRFQIWFVPTTLLELMILILFIIWIIRNASKRHTLNAKPWKFKWLLLAWLAVSAMAAVISPDKRAALGLWKAYFLEPVLFFIVFVNLVKDRKDLDLVFNSLGVSALAVSVYAIFQKFTGWGIANPFWQTEATRRVTSFFEYPNAVGLYLAPIIVLLIGYFISRLPFFLKSDWESKIVTCSVLCVIYLSSCAIFCAESEGGLFGLAAAAAVFLLFFSVAKAPVAIKKTAVILFSAVMIFLLIYPFLLLKFGDPYKSIDIQNPIAAYIYKKATLKDLSGAIRQEQWRETLLMLKENGRLRQDGASWFWGAGLAGYQTAIKPYYQEGIFYNFENDPDFVRKIVIFNEAYKARHWQPVEIFLYPHNIILNFWSELGLLGLAMFIYIVARFFILGFKKLFENWKSKIENYKICKYDNGLIIALMTSMVALIIHGLVDVPYFKNDLAVLFWLIIGLMAICREK